VPGPVIPQPSLSEQEGEDGLPPGVVLELLLVIPMLAKSPHCHLIASSHHEETSRQTLGHECKCYPGSNLICIVRTGDKVEQVCQGIGVRDWNLSFLGTSWSQVPEEYVTGKVAEFTKKKGCKAGVYLRSAGRSVERMVDMVGDVASKSPVVATVLEEIHDGHRGVRESMDEDSLKESLGIVSSPSCQGNFLSET